ncbi:HNH endonuclease [Priestia sp. SB1]|uniref:HNH endonuclease n=1 Tax=Priestia sp. SB1 TaxID=3132359 RepID=UPI0031726713
MKICKVCNIEKPLSEFYSQEKKKANGEKYIYFRPDCIECTIERGRINQLKKSDYYKEYRKNYYKVNKEAQRLRKRKWRRESRGYIREYHKNYYSENKEKFANYNKTRQNKNHEISNEQWSMCKEYFGDSCAFCGLTVEEHKEKHSQDLHKEHVVHNGADDLSNCIPACKDCNSRKWVHPLEYYYNEEHHEDFTKERLEKIYRWLEEDFKKYI